MPAQFAFAQVIGPYPGTCQDRGSYGELMCFKSVDEFGILSDFNDCPAAIEIPAGGQSMELWFQLHYTGVFVSVSNITLFLVQQNNQPVDPGLTVLFGVMQAFQTPVASVSSVAVNPLPTDKGASANVSIGGSVGGVLSAPGYSDFICLQLQIAPSYVGDYIPPLFLGVAYAET